MDKTQIATAGSRLAWLIGQVIVLIVCVAYINFVYYQNILPDKMVAETYGVSTCNIVGKQLTTRGRVVHHYRADFLVSYLANGKMYQSVASGNGLDRGMTRDKLSQQELLDQFDNGGAYPCWFNPITPQVIVLVQRHSWSSTFPLVVPSVVALIMIFYILKAIFMFLEVTRHYTVEVRRKREQRRK